jgi:hypothetical protein
MFAQTQNFTAFKTSSVGSELEHAILQTFYYFALNFVHFVQGTPTFYNMFRNKECALSILACYTHRFFMIKHRINS